VIAHLRGRIFEKHPNRIVVEVNGVGYDVSVPLSTFYGLGDPGSEIALRVHTHVREDALLLYGFATLLEQQLFERLISVSGIGPKVALAVLSGIEPADLIKARAVVDEIYMDEKIERYIVNVVDATRHPEQYNLSDLKGLIQYGASPRATIYLAVASKAHAFLQGRGYVTPQDIKSIGMDVLRHRVNVSYEAEAEEKTSEDIIKKIFDEIEVP